MAESNTTEIHIILTEIEDARFPGVKGIQIQMIPEPQLESVDEMSRAELTALQMIRLFHLYQSTQGSRQFINDEEILPGDREDEVDWAKMLDMEVEA